MHKNVLGLRGESIAVWFLKKKGYKILEKNYYTKLSEIDIIAKDKDDLVFVEVKTRADKYHGNPEDSVTTFKVHKLTRAIEIYLQKKKPKYECMRLDVVAIVLKGRDVEIEHFINVTV
jgi:putative endonuclease